jgi:hypothetical protein
VEEENKIRFAYGKFSGRKVLACLAAVSLWSGCALGVSDEGAGDSELGQIGVVTLAAVSDPLPPLPPEPPPACDPGLTRCDEGCVDTMTDPDNCGVVATSVLTGGPAGKDCA